MDRLGGIFGAHDDAHDTDEAFGLDGYEEADDHAPLAPPSPVGQDERRMQVRAYNHWASLLGSANFPDIADLRPETLEDFGPYGILLDFGGRRGVDDPAIRFLGEKLAEECAGEIGNETRFKRLSDVPGRSLLSRITDHYLQILANQAPIGFEAEFVNRRGVPVLYRGILLPWSSDGETIDFIFGVINWKETADAATAEALLAEIDASLDAREDSGNYAGSEDADDMDRTLDLGNFRGSADDKLDAARDASLPHPAFGASPPALSGHREEDLDEDGEEELGEPGEWGAGFSGFGEEDTVYAVDYGEQGLEEGEEGEDDEGVIDPLGDESASLGLASLVSRGTRVKQGVILPGAPLPTLSEPPAPEPEFLEEPVLDLADEMIALDPGQEDIFADDGAEGGTEEWSEEGEGLYDCLAAARELAQTARSSEDRGRKALYQAVARAYDFSLEAAANPADFEELLAENGLTVQDRAPMTPVVKLVFGADYDKTRLTEYATVLGYAHRTGVARGALGELLARAEGGLKGIVGAERRARRAEDGGEAGTPAGIRNALAKKLRKLEAIALPELAEDGPEFALVMIRRLPSGEVEIVGEVPEDVPLVEKAARKLLG